MKIPAGIDSIDDKPATSSVANLFEQKGEKSEEKGAKNAPWSHIMRRTDRAGS